MKFHTTLLQGDKTAVGMEVPPEVVEALGKGKRPPVRVTINGYTYRSTVAVMGGAFMIGVSADARGKAGVKGGDEVDVDLELDTAPREVTVASDLAEAMTREPDAQKFFESLSPSQKGWFVSSVGGAKTAETRQRRIDKALEMLRAGRKP
ncbi:MAG TPA: YdeI/OmpD-associated family protein [Chloroflexota bacterium]|jgi:hypothetical protein